MNYKDSKGTVIKNLSDWEKHIFNSGKKKKHWKSGRSAYEIANFLLNENGEKLIVELIESIVGETVTLDYAIPEMEVRFDKYGHGREHDVGVFGKTESKKRIFVGIESKVDEPFNEKIAEVYLKSKSKELSGTSTNSAKRIEELLKRNFKIIEPEYFDLRYQLLYSTIGTLEARENGSYADIYILFTIVFKTKLYDELKGIENYRDYIQFINTLDSQKLITKKAIDVHKVNIENRVLHTIYLNIEK